MIAGAAPTAGTGGADGPQAGILPAPGPDVPRVAVRRRLADGMLGDVVGHVLTEDSDALVLLPIDGPAVRIRPDDVMARRVVPERAVRPSSSAEAIERITSAGWPGLVVSRLGGWIVREGLGWTGRANSCLVAGDSGLAPQDALDLVATHYARVGLTPRLQLTHPVGQAPHAAAAAVEQAAEASGWVPYDLTHVLVTDLRRPLEGPLDREDDHEVDHEAAAGLGRRPGTTDRMTSPTVSAHWSDTVSPDWARIVRGAEVATDPRAIPVISAVPAQYLLLRETSGAAVAAGRLVRTGDWVGLSCIEVVPTHRGVGLGRAVTAALLQEARRGGARFAYVQVEDGNPALDLYRSLGFTPHHRYHYRALASRGLSAAAVPTVSSVSSVSSLAEGATQVRHG